MQTVEESDSVHKFVDNDSFLNAPRSERQGLLSSHFADHGVASSIWVDVDIVDIAGLFRNPLNARVGLIVLHSRGNQWSTETKKTLQKYFNFIQKRFGRSKCFNGFIKSAVFFQRVYFYGIKKLEGKEPRLNKVSEKCNLSFIRVKPTLIRNHRNIF